MAMTTISSKFQIVIPKEVREKLHLSPQQRLQVVEKGGVITLVPEGCAQGHVQDGSSGEEGPAVKLFIDSRIITGDADLKDLARVVYVK
jgi:AbrB family looped-hinge helix DNA binding protein